MELKAKIVQGVGQKSGKPYIAIEIEFPNGYKKLVFPENAETFILKDLLENKK